VGIFETVESLFHFFHIEEEAATLSLCGMMASPNRRLDLEIAVENI
jgi:hypothetical protein